MDDEELEQILKESLAGYAGCEPLAGLEERVLARVRLAESSRSSTAGLWAALALGAAVLAGIVVHPDARHTELQPTRLVSEAITRVAARPTVCMAAVHALTRPVRTHRTAALPKQGVFPAPTPLTAEERLVLAMLKRDPAGTAEAFESLRTRAREPLQIAPLVIPPLETGGGQ